MKAYGMAMDLDPPAKTKQRNKCFALIRQRGSIGISASDPNVKIWRELADEGVVHIREVPILVSPFVGLIIENRS